LISGFGTIKTGGGAVLIRRAKHKSVKVACGPLKGGYWHYRRDVLRGHEVIVFRRLQPRIVTASEDKTARIWDAATAKLRRTQLEATRKEIAELEQRVRCKADSLTPTPRGCSGLSPSESSIWSVQSSWQVASRRNQTVCDERW
jgi:WD40 repeat protein